MLPLKKKRLIATACGRHYLRYLIYEQTEKTGLEKSYCYGNAKCFQFCFYKWEPSSCSGTENSVNPTFTLWGLVSRWRRGVCILKAHTTCIKGIALDSGTLRVRSCSIVVSCVTGQWLKIPWLQFYFVLFCFFLNNVLGLDSILSKAPSRFKIQWSVY